MALKTSAKLSKLLPARLKKRIPLSLKNWVVKSVSQSSVPSYSPFRLRGESFANSPEDKVEEMRASQHIWANEELYFYDLNHPYLDQKISPFLPLLNELARTKPNLTIVDAGASWGSILNLILRKYPTFTGYGFDISPDACKMTRKGSLGNYFQADVESIPLLSESADVVLLMSTLHHFFRYPQRVLREVWRVLKPNGYLLINDPNSETEAPELHSKGDRIRQQIVELYDSIADLLGDKGVSRVRWGEPKAQVDTEAPIRPNLVVRALNEAGFSVRDTGYIMLTTIKVMDYPFGFDIAKSIDEILCPIVPKECNQVWFIAQKT